MKKSWFRRKKQPQVERKSALPITWPIQEGSTLDLSLRYGMGQYSALGASGAMSFYDKSSTVADAVDTIVDEVEKITPVLQGPDNKFVDNDEVLNKLRKPNDHEDYVDWIGQLARYYQIVGTSYVYTSGLVTNKPVELYATDPRSVSHDVATDEYAQSFSINHGKGSDRYVRNNVPNLGIRYYSKDNLQEIFTIKRFTSKPTSKVLGDSLLRAAILDVNNGVKSKFHNVKVIDNGGRLSLMVTFSDMPSDDELKERKEALKNELTGPENAGGIIVLRQDGVRAEGAPMSVQELGQTPKDMDFSNLNRDSDISIYRRFSIPLPLISTDHTTFSNYEKALEVLYLNAVLPLLDRMFSSLSQHLLPRYNKDPNYWKITYNIEDIPALQNYRMEMLERRVKMNLETANEYRSLLPGREPLEGDDVRYQPANLVPVGMDIFTDDNTNTQEEQERLARTPAPGQDDN